MWLRKSKTYTIYDKRWLPSNISWSLISLLCLIRKFDYFMDGLKATLEGCFNTMQLADCSAKHIDSYRCLAKLSSLNRRIQFCGSVTSWHIFFFLNPREEASLSSGWEATRDERGNEIPPHNNTPLSYISSYCWHWSSLLLCDSEV